jgi:tRNA pseudouridine38-40 synthase
VRETRPGPEPRRAEGPALRRWRLDVGYDGTDFSGWARQPGRRTVQAEVEAALATVLRLDGPPASTAAGRTDAGVHATGQVAHVDLPDRHPSPPVRRMLNAVLPPDVRVFRARPVPPSFDARFAALSRSYVYRVAEEVADPLRRRDTLVHPHRLDIPAMASALDGLLGKHDFAAFCRRRPGASTIRRLLAGHVRRRGGVVEIGLTADAFCHSMVRSLVGALLAVGDGRRPVGWPAGLLASTRRHPAVAVAPAHGLTLVSVRYPPLAGYRGRIEVTRARRGG